MQTAFLRSITWLPIGFSIKTNQNTKGIRPTCRHSPVPTPEPTRAESASIYKLRVLWIKRQLTNADRPFARYKGGWKNTAMIAHYFADLGFVCRSIAFRNTTTLSIQMQFTNVQSNFPSTLYAFKDQESLIKNSLH